MSRFRQLLFFLPLLALLGRPRRVDGRGHDTEVSDDGITPIGSAGLAATQRDADERPSLISAANDDRLVVGRAEEQPQGGPSLQDEEDEINVPHSEKEGDEELADREVIPAGGLKATQEETYTEESEPVVRPRASPAESLLDETLRLYLDATYMSSLPALRNSCLDRESVEEEQSSGDDKESININVSESSRACRIAEYIHGASTYLAKFNSDTNNTPGRGVGKKSRSGKACVITDITQEKYSYAQMFENFVIKGRPFKALMTNDSVITSNASKLLSRCLSAEANLLNSWTSDVSISGCIEFLNASSEELRVIVPRIAANSYLYRLVAVEQTESTKRSTSLPFTATLPSHWPSVFRLQKGKPSAVHQCPANMHMAVWQSSPSSVRIRTFPLSQAGQFGLSLRHNPLHFPLLDKDGFGQEATGFAETSLKAGEFVFLPNSVVVSFALADREEETRTTTDQDSLLFRACFVDASNLNAFQQHLSFVSQLSQHEEEVAKQIASPSFPTHMDRDAKDVDNSELIKAGQLLFSVTDNVVGDGDVEDSSTATPEKDKEENAEMLKKKGRNRADRAGRNRGSRSSGAFKEWQEANKWQKMVKSLTMPRPELPRVVSIGRNNVSLEWTSPFLPDETDKTRFGFNITICIANSVKKGCRALTLERTDSSLKGEPHSLRERIEKRPLQSSTRIFSFDILDLEPETAYRIRMNLFFDMAQSLASDWSKALITVALSSPSEVPAVSIANAGVIVSAHSCTSLKITALTPLDDGGSDILGYNVFFRIADPGYYNEWRYAGMHRHERLETGETTMVLRNLLPGPRYEVKVSAFNYIGNATLSLPSNTLATTCPKDQRSKALVCGHGHESHYEALTYAEMPHLKDMMEGNTVITIDDIRQTASCHGAGGSSSETFEIDGWAAHYSLKIVVSGAADWMTPDTHTSRSFVGRIALVRRGDAPLVAKARAAQEAGAVGLIVIDDDDGETSTKCAVFDQGCAPGATKAHGEGWGLQDVAAAWKSVHLPMLLLRANATSHLNACLQSGKKDEL